MRLSRDVQDKLAQLAVYREGINAHLTAAIALAKKSPAGGARPASVGLVIKTVD